MPNEIGPVRRKVLLMPARARLPADQPAPSDHEAVSEFVLDGRRYRLVPLDPPGHPPGAAAPAAEMLTGRELQIVALVADGRVNKQIADILRISEWTVSTHLKRIFAKLGVDTRAAMVCRCLGSLREREQ
jgi:DNA-binding CsgD family transcriptional regulator